MALALDKAATPVREDLVAATQVAWDRLARAGTWWTGTERLAIVAEMRDARACAFCATCREALSPFGPEGSHDDLGQLPAPVVDVVHRLVNDSGRLTRTWFQGIMDQGLEEGAYVETVGVVVNATAVDTLHRGLGLALPALPDAVPGEPSRVYPENARLRMAYVRTVTPKEATGVLAEAWRSGGEERYIPNVHQALSLVPAEALAFTAYSGPLYIDKGMINDLTLGRAISRPQIELLAGRMAALNECFY